VEETGPTERKVRFRKPRIKRVVHTAHSTRICVLLSAGTFKDGVRVRGSVL